MQKATQTIQVNLEDLLYINTFSSNATTKEEEQPSTGWPLNPLHKGVMYYLAHRVIPESKYTYYKDIYRHVENLCSTHLDGLLR